MITVGELGADVRADVWIQATPAAKTTYTLESKVDALYGRAIRSQVERVLADYGQPAVHLEIRDTGALPFVWEARLEAVLCAFLERPLPTVTAQHAPDGRKERLRRTRLYVPGNRPKMMPNAGLYGPDVLLFDLEDSVAPHAKQEARSLVRHALARLPWGGIERAVRINSGPEGLRDVEAVVPAGVDVLVVPKVEYPETLKELDAALEQLRTRTLLIPLLESALGVQNAYAVATASSRVAAIALGLEDYVADIGAERTSEGRESDYAHGQLVNAARAAGVAPLASVFPHFEDPMAVHAYARRMRGLGFEGIGCIHPRQIRPAHEAFMPSAEEVARARTIVEKYEDALKEGRGAVAVEGRMVDAPVAQRAYEVLRRAEVKT